MSIARGGYSFISVMVMSMLVFSCSSGAAPAGDAPAGDAPAAEAFTKDLLARFILLGNGDLLAIVGSETIQVWDLANHQMLREVGTALVSVDCNVERPSAALDGSRLLVWFSSTSIPGCDAVRVFDTHTGVAVGSIDLGTSNLLSPFILAADGLNIVAGGDALATTPNPLDVSLSGAANGTVYPAVAANGVFMGMIYPAGQRFLTTSDSGTQVWSFGSAVPLFTDPTTMVTYAPDGSTVAFYGTSFDLLRLVSVDTSAQTTLTGISGPTALLPGGSRYLANDDSLGATRMLAADGSGSPVTVWDQKFLEASFSNDGKRVALLGTDGVTVVVRALK